MVVCVTLTEVVVDMKRPFTVAGTLSRLAAGMAPLRWRKNALGVGGVLLAADSGGVEAAQGVLHSHAGVVHSPTCIPAGFHDAPSACKLQHHTPRASGGAFIEVSVRRQT